MHEEELYRLKEKLLKELSEYSENGKLSKDDAEVIKYLASGIDHICNIVDRMEEDEEYSQRGSYNRNMGGSYRNSSYARGRRNAKRDSMGRYSRNGLADQLEEMMQEAPNEQIRQQMENLMRQIEQM